MTDTNSSGPNEQTCASNTYQYPVEITADGCDQQTFDNTATVKGVDSGDGDEASATVTVDKACVAVSKTANATWGSKCDWTIDKSGPASAGVPAGGTTTVTYAVLVNDDCQQVIEVSGTITVENTGTANVTITDVSDQLGGTLDCSPIEGSALQPGDKMECTYDLALDSATDTTNTATAAWTYDGGSSSTDSDPVAVDFPETPTGTNTCVVVKDVTTGEVLDSELCVNEVPAGGASYSVTVSLDPTKCGPYTNVAEVIGDGSTVLDQDDATTTVGCLGYTMGFWGNKNGQELLASTDAFTNPVTLGINPGGCYVVVNTASKSTTIFPKSLNGFSAMQNCSALDKGINKNSFNTLLGQTLALSYNIRYVDNYAGQSIGDLGCTPVGGLTSASTVEDVLTYANGLIGNAKSGYGSTVTQSQIGDLNTLLGCLNREA